MKKQAAESVVKKTGYAEVVHAEKQVDATRALHGAAVRIASELYDLADFGQADVLHEMLRAANPIMATMAILTGHLMASFLQGQPREARPVHMAALNVIALRVTDQYDALAREEAAAAALASACPAGSA